MQLKNLTEKVQFLYKDLFSYIETHGKISAVFVLGVFMGLLVMFLVQQHQLANDIDVTTERPHVESQKYAELATSTKNISAEENESVEEVENKSDNTTDIIERVSVPVVVAPPTREAVVPVISPDLVAEIAQQYVVTAAHRSVLLAEHNLARTAVGVTPLAWSSTVAASAQVWADVLEDRGCGLTHSIDSGYGENLANAWTSRDSVPLDPADAVRRWVAEEVDYDYVSNACEAGAVCGHYTQVVWEDSVQVGCGVGVCAEDGFKQVWVCQYDPPGNWVGEQPY